MTLNHYSPRKRAFPFPLLLGLMLFINSFAATADTVYETPDNFIKNTVGEMTKPSVIWLDKSTQADITRILGHPYPQARLRYWRKNETTAWVLEDIGKEYPITAGFVVILKAGNHSEIERAQVLIYRETRGMEIHLPAFLQQFTGNHLENEQLTKAVDGISGATLSVNAMKKMAILALTLNDKAH